MPAFALYTIDLTEEPKMKKFFSFAAFALLAFTINAQITVDQSDFADAGETVYLSTGQPNPLLNFASTGANHTWNFTSLRSTGQQQIDYLNVASTNGVYAFYYADVFFNPNRANIATSGTDIPFNQVLGAANPYTFFYKNANAYRKVGYGSELAGLPVPLAMTVPDTVYRFPMNYGNTSSSNSSYSASLPSVLTSVYTQLRNTTIDGWGTLTTPYGTFNVLRSKSEVFGYDSVYVDSLHFGVNIARAKVTEYKWIAKGEEVPVLQINTSTVFGIEVVSQILFKDAKLSITVDSLNGVLCPGTSATVHYTSTGTFNAPAFLQQGNKFTVQLSNSSGSFASPANIGNVTATASGTVNVTIPNNATGGMGYKLRIISNSPADTSTVFGPFTINPKPTASITPNGSTTICVYDSLELVANGISGFQFNYQWKFNTTDIGGATAQSYFASAAGDYTVAVSNICGTATSQALTLTVNPEPTHVLVPSDTSTCDGSPIFVTASNTSGVAPVTYQWNENGSPISGATDSMLQVTASGEYSLAVADGFGCVFATPSLTLVIDSMHTPVVQFSGSTTFCPGGNVALTTDSNPAYFYQWQKDGVDIPGATAFTYVAVVGGDYSIKVSDTCDFAFSQIIPVTVTARPVHTVIPSSPASCDGNPVVIIAHNASGASPLTYQWFDSSNAISGATDTLLTVTSAGSYSLLVTDRFGCTFNSIPLSIVFGSLPTPVVYADGSTSFCFGESVTLATDTNSNYTYQWLIDGTNINAANEYFYVVTEGGNYAVEVSIGGGCNSTSIIEKVNVYPQPQTPVITQQGDSLFSTSASGYQWYLNGSLLPGANSQAYHPGVNGSYIVEITDASGCSNSSLPFYVTNTGIIETAAGNWELVISPNPMLGSEFSISSSEIFSEIRIFTAAGALLFKNNLTAPAEAFVVNDYITQPGVYFLQVKSKKGLKVVKLVKM